MQAARSGPVSGSTTITITAAALLGLGVIMVCSADASLTSSAQRVAPLRDPSVKQAIFSALGLLSLLSFGLCSYRLWRVRKGSVLQPAVFLLILTLVLVTLVLVPGIGHEQNGARRWLPLGPAGWGLRFQPSEIAKIGLVVFLAAYGEFVGRRIQRFFTGLLPALLVLAVIVGAVGVEDLGTAGLLALVGGCMLLGAGARLRHLALAAVPAIAGIAYLVALRPYRLQRLTSFLSPESDPLGAGYHQIQSLVTIVSGGWWGRGLGAGIQKYGYLPEGRADFIFAVICEELGLVGGIAVLALFGILIWQGKRAMDGAPSELGRLLALGVTLMIGLQAAMNVAVVTVSVPTKGIALPFVSAGGTGVVVFSILVGQLANVARRACPARSVRGDRRWTHPQIDAEACIGGGTAPIH